jgi:hypothetical protein
MRRLPARSSARCRARSRQSRSCRCW